MPGRRGYSPGVSDAGEVLSSGSDRPGRGGRALLVLAVLAVAAAWFADDVAGLLQDRTTVPRAGDRPVGEAVTLLREAGLDVATHRELEPCWPGRWVIDQAPKPGAEVEPGSTVRLTVTDPASSRSVCPAGVATDNDRALSARFIAFAQTPGPGHDLPWAGRVRVIAPGTDEVVTGERADDAATWTTADRYLLAPATTIGSSWIVQAAEERRCPDPPALAAYRRIAVSDTDPTGAPDRRFDDCRPGSAVSLYVDRDYRIHGVQVIGPLTPP
ncbi:PASTA domain-containing protein [Nocardioides iriomotensis]|uniref:PASTA domain-containing protein n=1 Tax=Nocardioides iriomotensis TaxID=715784 RepID=A0A4Q5J4Q8_9ACTN|nr:PASTA domain-containing protein [Nocardioides iriomotensis]